MLVSRGLDGYHSTIELYEDLSHRLENDGYDIDISETLATKLGDDHPLVVELRRREALEDVRRLNEFLKSGVGEEKAARVFVRWGEEKLRVWTEPNQGLRKGDPPRLASVVRPRARTTVVASCAPIGCSTGSRQMSNAKTDLSRTSGHKIRWPVVDAASSWKRRPSRLGMVSCC